MVSSKHMDILEVKNTSKNELSVVLYTSEFQQWEAETGTSGIQGHL